MHFMWKDLDNLSRRRLEFLLIDVARKGEDGITFDHVAQVIDMVGPGSTCEVDGEAIELGPMDHDCWNNILPLVAVIDATNHFLSKPVKKKSGGKKKRKAKRSSQAT